MYKIYIDTSKRFEKSVKLLRNEVKVDSRFGDIDIVFSLKALLDAHDLKIQDIADINVNPGPGSFTGLKVGVTIANVLNWSLGRKKSTEFILPNYGAEPNITLKETRD